MLPKAETGMIGARRKVVAFWAKFQDHSVSLGSDPGGLCCYIQQPFWPLPLLSCATIVSGEQNQTRTTTKSCATVGKATNSWHTLLIFSFFHRMLKL